jgi:hypothetical protein
VRGLPQPESTEPLRHALAMSPRSFSLLTLSIGCACGLIATVLVAALIHFWKIPVNSYFGAWALFFPPIALTVLAQLPLLGQWRKASSGSRLLSAAFALIGAGIGVVISIPMVCSIAGECL